MKPTLSWDWIILNLRERPSLVSTVRRWSSRVGPGVASRSIEWIGLRWLLITVPAGRVRTPKAPLCFDNTVPKEENKRSLFYSFFFLSCLFLVYLFKFLNKKTMATPTRPLHVCQVTQPMPMLVLGQDLHHLEPQPQTKHPRFARWSRSVIRRSQTDSRRKCDL
jgi:hypothetical protein